MSAPRLLTERQVILVVRKRWLEQYRSSIDGVRKDDPHGAHHRETYAKLCTLDLETCSAADVNAAIGNNSWTALSCDGCERRDCKTVVEVGQPHDYESRTVTLCRACVDIARATFGGVVS